LLVTAKKKMRVAMGRMRGTIMEKKRVKVNKERAMEYLNPRS
jgi:hypothetical protein